MKLHADAWLQNILKSYKKPCSLKKVNLQPCAESWLHKLSRVRSQAWSNLDLFLQQ